MNQDHKGQKNQNQSQSHVSRPADGEILNESSEKSCKTCKNGRDYVLISDSNKSLLLFTQIDLKSLRKIVKIISFPTLIKPLYFHLIRLEIYCFLVAEVGIVRIFNFCAFGKAVKIVLYNLFKVYHSHTPLIKIGKIYLDLGASFSV